MSGGPGGVRDREPTDEAESGRIGSEAVVGTGPERGLLLMGARRRSPREPLSLARPTLSAVIGWRVCYKNNTQDRRRYSGGRTLMDTGPSHRHLSRRERQIMDILFRLGCAPATVVREELPGTPSLSTVRTQLRILEQKGYVRHEEQGLRYVYRPVTTRRAARRSALRHLVGTFFDGSAEQAVAALLGGEAKHLTEPELERIAQFVADAKAAQRDPGHSVGAPHGKEPDGNDSSAGGGDGD